MDSPPVGGVRTWRDILAMVLMLLAALGALLSFVGSLGTVLAAPPPIQLVESWRMYGFLVFAGLFVLLALWPRLYPGVWELVIFHKAAMAITAAALIGRGALEATLIATVDGTLAVLAVVAYLLSRGYTSWSRLRAPQR